MSMRLRDLGAESGEQDICANGIGLHAQLAQQFAMAQKTLAEHHAQALQIVKHLSVPEQRTSSTTSSAAVCAWDAANRPPSVDSCVPGELEKGLLRDNVYTDATPKVAKSSLKETPIENLQMPLHRRSSRLSARTERTNLKQRLSLRTASPMLSTTWPSKCSDIVEEIKTPTTRGGAHTGSRGLQSPKQSVPKAVFADVTQMKEKVRQAIMKPEYSVCNFYKSSGYAQAIAKSIIFDNATLCVIALNAIWIAIDTDMNDAATLAEAHPFFQLGENLFCVYFSVEWLIRYIAFRQKSDCLKDGSFMFDSALVIMMVLETWLLSLVFFLMGRGSDAGLGDASILRLIRLLRLTRMARMVRLLRALPELMIMVKGISVATRSVFFTLCLLAIFLYIFGIAFTQLSKGTSIGVKYFPSVHKSMSTLLLRGTLPDMADFVEEIDDEHWALTIVMLIFILISTLTVMNMLVGVLCEVVSVVSAVEKENMAVQFVKAKLMSLMARTGIAEDGHQSISKQEFETLLLMPEGARVIEEIGVDVVGLVDFADDIFKDGTELSFADFMELVLQLRNNNTATVKDIVELRKLVQNLFQDEEHSAIMQESFEGIRKDLHHEMRKATLAALHEHSMQMMEQYNNVALTPQPVAVIPHRSAQVHPEAQLPAQVPIEDAIEAIALSPIEGVVTASTDVGPPSQVPEEDVIEAISLSAGSFAAGWGQPGRTCMGPSWHDTGHIRKQSSSARPQSGSHSRPQSRRDRPISPKKSIRPPSASGRAQSNALNPGMPVPPFPPSMWLTEYEGEST